MGEKKRENEGRMYFCSEYSSKKGGKFSFCALFVTVLFRVSFHCAYADCCFGVATLPFVSALDFTSFAFSYSGSIRKSRTHLCY